MEDTRIWILWKKCGLFTSFAGVFHLKEAPNPACGRPNPGVHTPGFGLTPEPVAAVLPT